MTVTARLHVEGIDVWVAQEFEVLAGGEVDPVGFAWLENDETLPMSVPEETVKWIMSRPVAPGAKKTIEDQLADEAAWEVQHGA